jgi:putative restriction endonuclease
MRGVAPGDVVFSFADTRVRAIGIAASHAHEAPKPMEFGQTGAYWDTIGWRVDVKFAELRPAASGATIVPHADVDGLEEDALRGLSAQRAVNG